MKFISKHYFNKLLNIVVNNSIYLNLAVLVIVSSFGCSSTLQSFENSDNGQAIKINKSPNDSIDDNYQIISLMNWDYIESGRNEKIEARLESIKVNSGNKEDSLPISRLIIKNVTLNKVIFEYTNDAVPITMYKVDVGLEPESILVVTWSGGSADHIEIFTIDERPIKKVFSNYYRGEAIFADLFDDKKKDLFITTTDDKTGEFFLYRYVWREHEFVLTGKVKYNKFVSILKGILVQTN